MPFEGGETTAILVTLPLICALRSIAIGVANATATDLAVTTGAAGKILILTGGDGSDIPPVPAAVYRKLSAPV